MVPPLFQFCYCATQPTKPHSRARILFSLGHANEAWQANLHRDERIMNWQPFMNHVHCVRNLITAFLEFLVSTTTRPHLEIVYRNICSELAFFVNQTINYPNMALRRKLLLFFYSNLGKVLPLPEFQAKLLLMRIEIQWVIFTEAASYQSLKDELSYVILLKNSKSFDQTWKQTVSQNMFFQSCQSYISLGNRFGNNFIEAWNKLRES